MRIPRARWNGKPCVAERGTVVMAKKSGFPGFWGRDLLGTRVVVLRISTDSQVFFIMDEDRQGTEKVQDGGGPWSGRGHRSVPVDDPDTFKPESMAHSWGKRFGMTVCLTCGIVRRSDGMNKPCRGPVAVGPRR